MYEFLAFRVKERRRRTLFRILRFGAILYGCTREGLILLGAYFVLENFESFRDVPRHGEVHLATFVIPIEGDSDVSFSIPFRSNAVIIF